MRDDAFMREHFKSDAVVTPMRPGEWSRVYSVGTADREFVVRFSEYDEDFEKDAFVSRFSSRALPIPPILEWGRASIGFYAISERVAGEHIDTLDETRMRRVLPSLFSALDAMREIDLSEARGFGGWRADGRTAHGSWRETLLAVASEKATRGAPGWRELLAPSATGVAPFEQGYERMRELVELCPEERHLVHDDLINYNVLVQGDRISAVLDWGSSIYGDFLYDIAKLVFYRPWFPAWADIDFAAEARGHYDRIGLDVPRFAERIRCYCLRIGIADMAYSAFRKRWDEVDRKAKRIRELG